MALVFMESYPYSLILASTSSYRKALLNRLHLPFVTFAPEVDETPLVGESAPQLVSRLSKLKAEAAQKYYPRALVIGSDQVAVVGHRFLGKPENHEQAVEQLSALSGQQVDFLTGLCLLNTATSRVQLDIVQFSVVFRHLKKAQIENYLLKDKPYNCSGSFKSEGLGISLLKKMLGDDPTALMGLPLIRLVNMLETESFYVI